MDINKKLRALVADDENTIRIIVSTILAKLGFSITEARDGGEALNLFESGLTTELSYDLVATDNRMPKLDGIELANVIREMGEKVPIVLISGTLTEDLKARALKLDVKTMSKAPADEMEFGLRQILRPIFPNIPWTY